MALATKCNENSYHAFFYPAMKQISQGQGTCNYLLEANQNINLWCSTEQLASELGINECYPI